MYISTPLARLAPTTLLPSKNPAHWWSSFSVDLPYLLECCNHPFSIALPRAKMEQPTTAQSWVQVPQHRQWGFDEPRPELLKIVIDLRAKEHQPTHHPPPEIGYGPSLTSILSHHQQAKASNSSSSGSLNIITANSQQNLQIGGQQSSGSYVPELFVCLLS